MARRQGAVARWNPREAELMVAAARKHKRVVQMGNRRRSWPSVDNLVHYNRHWRWHWGNGEPGNNRVNAALRSPFRRRVPDSLMRSSWTSWRRL